MKIRNRRVYSIGIVDGTPLDRGKPITPLDTSSSSTSTSPKEHYDHLWQEHLKYHVTQPASPYRRNSTSSIGISSPLRRANSFLDGFGASMGRYLEVGMERPPPTSGMYRHLYARELDLEQEQVCQEQHYKTYTSEKNEYRDTIDQLDVGSAKDEDSQQQVARNGAYEQAQLLLVSLLENFCALYDRNPDKNQRLFISLCKQLWGMGILTSDDFFNRSERLRGVYKEAFRRLVLQAIEGIEKNTIECGGEDGDKVKLLKDHVEEGKSLSDSSSPEALDEQNDSEFDDTMGSFGLFEVKPVTSRLESEFKDLEVIGKGGFAQVLRGTHRIDHCPYAFKRIEFTSKSGDSYGKIIREIKSLAHLDHPYIVRYHGAWIEEKPINRPRKQRRSSLENVTESCSPTNISSSTSIGITVPVGNSAQDFEIFESVGYFMIIQMELCQFTLADWIEQRNFLIRYGKTWRLEYGSRPSKVRTVCIPSDRMATMVGDGSWDINPTENCRIFKCIVKALQHIHAQGIIHRDLKPGNILFQVHGEEYIPKIGDFGLASDISMAPTENHQNINRQPTVFCPSASLSSFFNGPSFINDDIPGVYYSPTNSRSMTRTTGVGTCMYAAPEQIRDSDYNEKVDIFSLGIILFELFHPFATRMERHDVLEDLKNGIIPAAFVKRWPKETTLIWSCICPNATMRPSADQILDCEILEQDPVDIIDRLVKENSTLKKLLEVERERVKVLEQGLARANHSFAESQHDLVEDLCVKIS